MADLMRPKGDGVLNAAGIGHIIASRRALSRRFPKVNQVLQTPRTVVAQTGCVDSRPVGMWQHRWRGGAGAGLNHQRGAKQVPQRGVPFRLARPSVSNRTLVWMTLPDGLV